MENKEKILQLINSSFLEEERKTLWLDFLGFIKENEAEIIFDVLQENDNLILLTENIEEKIEAFKNCNKEKILEILKEEDLIFNI